MGCFFLSLPNVGTGGLPRQAGARPTVWLGHRLPVVHLKHPVEHRDQRYRDRQKPEEFETALSRSGLLSIRAPNGPLALVVRHYTAVLGPFLVLDHKHHEVPKRFDGRYLMASVNLGMAYRSASEPYDR